MRLVITIMQSFFHFQEMQRFIFSIATLTSKLPYNPVFQHGVMHSPAIFDWCHALKMWYRTPKSGCRALILPISIFGWIIDRLCNNILPKIITGVVHRMFHSNLLKIWKKYSSILWCYWWANLWLMAQYFLAGTL